MKTLSVFSKLRVSLCFGLQLQADFLPFITHRSGTLFLSRKLTGDLGKSKVQTYFCHEQQQVPARAGFVSPIKLPCELLS